MTTRKPETPPGVSRYDMPSGAWIECRTVDSLNRRERRDLRARIADKGAELMGTNPTSLSRGQSMQVQAEVQDAVIWPAVIVAWSYDEPLPPDADTFDRVFDSRAADEACFEAVAREFYSSLFPDFSPKLTANGQGVDPKALTPSS